MTDLKTTAFEAAATLDGSEIVGIVQAGDDVQTTIALIGAYVSGGIHLTPYSGMTNLTIGLGAHHYSGAVDSIAIGFNSYVNNVGVAIGSYASASGVLSIALGDQAKTYGAYDISIGYHAKSRDGYTIAIGADSYAKDYASIAIGKGSSGFATGIAIGESAYAHGFRALAIGTNAMVCNSYYGIAIGLGAIVGLSHGSVAIGYRSSANSNSNHSVCIGSHAACYAYNGVAIGQYAHSSGTGGIAFGYRAVATTNSVAIGTEANAIVIGSFVVTGFPGSATPTETSFKLVTITTGSTAATYVWSDIPLSYTATVTFDIPGDTGNSATFAIDASTGPLNRALQGNHMSTTFQLVLATDGAGVLDASQNTLLNIASLFSSSGFSFSYTSGHDSDVVDFPIIASNLQGGIGPGPGTVVMSADQTSPTNLNTPSMPFLTVAMVSATIVGYQHNLIGQGGAPNDAANFTMSPVIIYRNNAGDYSIIGTPTFILTNSTSGASDWSVPTLNITGTGDSSIIEVGVFDQNSGDIQWLAFVDFQSSM
jgi:hypothetical protein